MPFGVPVKIDEPVVKKFLAKYPAKTWGCYKIYLTKEKFMEFFGKSASDVKAEYDNLETMKDLLEFARRYGERIQALYESGKVPVTGTTALRAWFKSQTVPTGVTHCKIKSVPPAGNYYRLRTRDVRMMIDVCDLREQTILCLANNLGLRPLDFCLFKRKPFVELIRLVDAGHEDYVEEPYLLKIVTHKKRVLAWCCLLDESVGFLRQYLSGSQQENAQFLFPNQNGKRLTPRGLNKILRAAWKRAYSTDKTPSKFSWKCFRKRLKREMAKAGITEPFRNVIVGHEVEGTQGNYELGSLGTEDDIREEFRKAMARVRVFPRNPVPKTGLRLETLEQRLVEKEAKMEILENQILKVNRTIEEILGMIDRFMEEVKK